MFCDTGCSVVAGPMADDRVVAKSVLVEIGGVVAHDDIVFIDAGRIVAERIVADHRVVVEA